jgi:tetratricopeptide (TPR) repeat protein
MVSTDVVEKYQTILRHNPMSQVFAPLADAYLERGLDLQAEELLLQGTQRHPLFASGFVILGKTQLKLKKFEIAELSLKKALELSKQNILAHQLLGDVYLAQKKPFEALKAYKMVLFLNPYSAKAKQAIDRLETASALEFEEETFAMAKLSDLKKSDKNLTQLLQLVDAFLVRGEFEESQHLLEEMQKEHGEHAEIQSRLKRVLSRLQSKSTHVKPPTQPLSQRIEKEKKIRKLYAMLRSVRMQMGSPNP